MVIPCRNSLWVVNIYEKNRLVTTRCFNQYTLIILTPCGRWTVDGYSRSLRDTTGRLTCIAAFQQVLRNDVFTCTILDYQHPGSTRRSTQLAAQPLLVEHLHINPDVAGSNPALVNFSLFIQNLSKMYPLSFHCGLLHDIYRKKNRIPILPLPRLYRNLGLDPWLKGSIWLNDFWLAPPEQRYWQNRETANIGLVSSVGRVPAHQSGGLRFKSRSSQYFFVHSNLLLFCSLLFSACLVALRHLYIQRQKHQIIHYIKHISNY